MTIVVAIDGPAGSGKGTIARNISKKYDFPHLDSGSLYRGVAASVLETGKKKIDEKVALEVAKNLIPQAIDEKKIRNREVDEAASIVSSISGVRRSLKKLQRDFKRINAKKNGIVVDGRDIGTVVFPNADYKFFLSVFCVYIVIFSRFRFFAITSNIKRYEECTSVGNSTFRLLDRAPPYSSTKKIIQSQNAVITAFKVALGLIATETFSSSG